MSERRAEFERDGFIVIPGFASASACEQLREAAEALVEAADIASIRTAFDVRGQRHGEDPWFLESGGEVRAFLEPERDDGHARVNKLGHALHDRVPIFDQFSRTPELAALVAELGVAQPRLLQSMVIFKHPRVGGQVTAHQDATYLYTEPQSVIGLWFALEDASLDNGCLELLPGGHRLGLRKRYRREGDRTWTQILDARAWPHDGWRPVEVPAGTLVAFGGLLPHRSAANRSARSRCAYTLHVIDGVAEYAADNWLQRPPDMPLRGF
ncbi:phytanoyl-CoA dioxygenase family protein [Enhygromyxa salina]|uniref:phytanoyl-CoA dioxygenase family protein n=1 Tax=Enhygromyxa salina TaxID=215803 RepID=UPI000D03CDAC|nr:phytanoyl-CoA dioxygenase family protein [Enhygromyxa salina]